MTASSGAPPGGAWAAAAGSEICPSHHDGKTRRRRGPGSASSRHCVVLGCVSAVNIAALVIGAILVVSTWSGMLATFVLPRGRSLFQLLPNAVVRAVHAGFVQLARTRRDYTDKDGVLAAVGPAALIAQLAVFLFFFLLGFALILLNWTHDFGRSLVQAAAALFTIGLAHAGGPTSDPVIVLGAVTGGVAIALQIGYLPTIYQSFARRESLVALMESRAGVPAWGPEMLMRHQLVTSLDALPGFYRDWELWSADLAESHGTHPVLILFRSADPGYSWLLSLLAVLDAAALHLALCPGGAPHEARMCLRMGFTALRRVAYTLRWPFNPDPLPGDPIDLGYTEFASAVAQLVEIGFPVERSAEEAWPHFRGWRVNYESIAYRLADHLVAPHAPWSGPRHHLPIGVIVPARPPHRSPDGSERPADLFRAPR